MTTWAEYREKETARLADELAQFWPAVAAAPWYGRWAVRVLYGACRLWARFRR